MLGSCLQMSACSCCWDTGHFPSCCYHVIYSPAFVDNSSSQWVEGCHACFKYAGALVLSLRSVASTCLFLPPCPAIIHALLCTYEFQFTCMPPQLSIAQPSSLPMASPRSSMPPASITLSIPFSLSTPPSASLRASLCLPPPLFCPFYNPSLLPAALLGPSLFTLPPHTQHPRYTISPFSSTSPARTCAPPPLCCPCCPL